MRVNVAGVGSDVLVALLSDTRSESNEKFVLSMIRKVTAFFDDMRLFLRLRKVEF